MKVNALAVIAVGAICVGCAHLSGDYGVLIRRQEALEAKVDRLSRDVEELQTKQTGASGDSGETASRIDRSYRRLEARVKELEGDISVLKKGSARSADALYALALSYYNEGAYEDAILEFQKFIVTSPKNHKIPDAYLKQGLSLIRMGRAKEARFFFQTLIDKYPNSKEAEFAQQKLKELDERS